MKEYVPLIQTVLWMLLILSGALIMRPELRELRKALVERLKSGGSVKVGPFELGEVKRELAEVRNEVNDLHSRISRLFLLAMSDNMFKNLRKLASGRFGEFEKSAGLDRELRSLRELGYVRAPGPHGIGGIPPRGENLSDFVEVTDAGRQFVQLRDELSVA